MILQSKPGACRDELTRAVDLLDPGGAAVQEMCYLHTHDYQNMFSISWRCKINNCLAWLTESAGSEWTGKCPEGDW